MTEISKSVLVNFLTIDEGEGGWARLTDPFAVLDSNNCIFWYDEFKLFYRDIFEFSKLRPKS